MVSSCITGDLVWTFGVFLQEGYQALEQAQGSDRVPISGGTPEMEYGHGLVMAFRRPKMIAGVNDLEGLFQCM